MQISIIINGELMKKNIFTILFHLVIAISIGALCVNMLPFNADFFDRRVSSVFSHRQSNVTDITNNNDTDDDNNNSTTSGKSQDEEKVIAAKDSDLYSDISETPDDIAKLMKEEEKSIESQEVRGKTSEEDYFGGGTLVSYDNVEVQSKIPDSFYNLDIEALLGQDADLSVSDASKPTVLVYHSHTTESYTLLDVGYYTDSTDLRSEDNSRNVVRVGDEICKYLELQGIGVVHDTEIHDTNYSAAYDNSRQTVEEYLEEYPTIEITIDLHRDDITYDDDTKVKPTAVINGKKAARMMLIAGCQYGRVENFPDWEDNLRFDLATQKAVCDMYDGLMRPILFSERKYNMFETHNSFLLEIGTDGNTLDEACYSARLFASAFGKMILEKYTED